MSFNNNNNAIKKRSKYSKISDELRNIIIKRFEDSEPITNISQTLGLSKSTVFPLCRKFDNTGTTLPQQRGGNKKSKLSNEQKAAICNWVDENAILTLKDLQSRIKEEFNVDCSISTIDRTLKGFHYSFKQAYPVPVPRNSTTTVEKRFEYALEFRRLEESFRVE